MKVQLVLTLEVSDRDFDDPKAKAVQLVRNIGHNMTHSEAHLHRFVSVELLDEVSPVSDGGRVNMMNVVNVTTPQSED